MNAQSQVSSSSDPYWNPRPNKNLTSNSLTAYRAGYSDAYHGHRFDSGDWGDFSDYRTGYNDGAADVIDPTECMNTDEYLAHVAQVSA